MFTVAGLKSFLKMVNFMLAGVLRVKSKVCRLCNEQISGILIA